MKGIGKTTWFKYFKPINYFQTVKEPCIFFSYIKEVQLFGEGFKLSFNLKIDKKPVSLYIDGEQIRNYRHRNYLKDIVQNLPHRQPLKDDIRAYFVPHDIRPNKFGGYDVIIDDLSKLAITYNLKMLMGS